MVAEILTNVTPINSIFKIQINKNMAAEINLVKESRWNWRNLSEKNKRKKRWKIRGKQRGKLENQHKKSKLNSSKKVLR